MIGELSDMVAAGQAAGCPCGAGSLSPRSKARTSDSRNLRCPPGVRILVIRPEAAQRVTVFGSTRNSDATSPGVSRRSLLPSTFSPSDLSPSCLRSDVPLVWRSTSTFSRDFWKLHELFHRGGGPIGSRNDTPGNARTSLRCFSHFLGCSEIPIKTDSETSGQAGSGKIRRVSD